MCDCWEDVKIGNYYNTVIVEYPFIGKKIQIDKCLEYELKILWEAGVKTEASCCGHNQLYPSVIVDKQSVKMMEYLGYKHIGNKATWFFPKTIKFDPYQSGDIKKG
jgi:hypothetical protein